MFLCASNVCACAKRAGARAFISVITHAVMWLSVPLDSVCLNMRRLHQNLCCFVLFCFTQHCLHHSVLFPEWFSQLCRRSLLPLCSPAFCSPNIHAPSSSPDSQWQTAPLTPLFLCHGPVIQAQTTAICLLTGISCNQTAAVPPPPQHRKRGLLGLRDAPRDLLCNLTDCQVPIPARSMSWQLLTHKLYKNKISTRIKT